MEGEVHKLIHWKSGTCKPPASRQDEAIESLSNSIRVPAPAADPNRRSARSCFSGLPASARPSWPVRALAEFMFENDDQGDVRIDMSEVTRKITTCPA